MLFSYRSRGAAYVEVLVIVGVVLVLGVLALTTLGRSSSSLAEKEAACIATLSCSGSGGGSGSDVSSMAGGGTKDGASAPKGVWERATDVAKGFFVDGLWGTAIDFLSDVWDTLGEPEFGMEECQRVRSTLYPAAMQDREVCPLCLDALTSASGASHFDACAVQSEWRSLRPDHRS